MPLTPRFSLGQDDDFVFIKINVPFVKTSSTEIIAENKLFTFYCKPYLLKLELPGGIVDDDRSKALYDPVEMNGTVNVSLPKANVSVFYTDRYFLIRNLSFYLARRIF